jgi:hypothetical protein
VGARSYNLGMAGAARRGYGEDGIYFDHRGDCRDSALHKICAGRWRGVVSLGFDADGKRLRRKVSGQTKAEVKDKLKALHSELDAGLRTAQGYTVEKAVADWLEEGLPGRTAKTVEANRDSLRPLLAVIGRIPLKDLTVQDVRTALTKMAATHSTRTLQKGHNCLSGCGGQPKKASPGRTCRTTSRSAAVGRPWWSTAGQRTGAVPANDLERRRNLPPPLSKVISGMARADLARARRFGGLCGR